MAYRMNKAALDKPEVRDAKTGKYLPGNKTGCGPPPAQEVTVDQLRADVLRNWGKQKTDAVLNDLRAKNVAEYAKLVVGLIPKKDDSIVTRVVEMTFDTVDSIPDTPSEILEDTPGDATGGDI